MKTLYLTYLYAHLKLVVLLLSITPVFSQELSIDENTLLLLHFNNNANGAQGEVPVYPSRAQYAEGVFGSALASDIYTELKYDTTRNVNTREGTLEFWLKPEDFYGAGYIFDMRTTNGMFIEVGYWTSIYINTFAANPNPQVGATIPEAAWFPGKWYHLAFTWGKGELKIYLNGMLLTMNTYDFEPSPIPIRYFSIASNLGGGADYIGLLDELRISDIARSEEQIFEDYLLGWGAIEKIVTHPRNISLFKDWKIHLDYQQGYQTPQVYTKKGSDSTLISNAYIDWSVSDPSVLQFEESSKKVKAVQAGTADLIGNVDGQEFRIPVTVRLPVLAEERISAIDPFLASPAFCYNTLVPVAVFIYLPTRDGVNIDVAEVPNVDQSLETVKRRCLETAKFTKFSLEEGSKFRGYQNPDAAPYLGYQIVDYVYIYEPVPRGFKSPGYGWFADGNLIMDRFDGKRLVDSLGVKEIWLFGYDIADIAAVESNMSSPSTGDISNSYRIPNDLPVYNNTYIVYNNNIQRGGNEAVHNHGHQIESMLSYSAIQAHGNADLFWNDFVGRSGPNYSTPPLGRCGDTHHPPNTTTDYDYCNSTLVASDIFDWKPEGGVKTLVNCDTWASIPYAWPEGVEHDANSNFFILWMQSLPGYGNDISYGSRYLANWWKIISEWDNNYALGLHQALQSEEAPACESSLTALADIDALCAGSMDTVRYESEHILFGGENVFTVQLSNAGGDFSNPIVIADHYSSEPAGAVIFRLPYFLPAGNNYQVRLVSTRPAKTGQPSRSFTIKATPASPAVLADGSTSLCSGQTVVLVSSVNRNVKWYKDYLPLKTHRDRLRVDSEGMYWATTYFLECESEPSNALVVTINPTPPQPEIYQSGNTLFSSAPDGNQWYRNGQIIAGANEASFYVMESGKYQVQVISEYSCGSALSKSYHVIVGKAANRDVARPVIDVFPNPVNEKLFIVTDSIVSSLVVRVVDFRGNEQLMIETKEAVTEVDVGELRAGLYMLRIESGKKVIVTRRLLKR